MDANKLLRLFSEGHRCSLVSAMTPRGSARAEKTGKCGEAGHEWNYRSFEGEVGAGGALSRVGWREGAGFFSPISSHPFSLSDEQGNKITHRCDSLRSKRRVLDEGFSSFPRERRESEPTEEVKVFPPFAGNRLSLSLTLSLFLFRLSSSFLFFILLFLMVPRSSQAEL